MTSTNTGNTRVIVITVPSSAIIGVYGLYLQNVIIELLKIVPFNMLLKIFPGIRLDPPLTLARNGIITQQASKELYGGILIKLPSFIQTIVNGTLNVTNYISIYVYDAKTLIPDMQVAFLDTIAARQATFGVYRVNTDLPFVMNSPATADTEVEIFKRSAPFKIPDYPIPSVTTLGHILRGLDTMASPVPKVLLHGLCGVFDDNGREGRETATRLLDERLPQIHPRAVNLSTYEEMIMFCNRLGNAVFNFVRQVAPVTSSE